MWQRAVLRRFNQRAFLEAAPQPVCVCLPLCKCHRWSRTPGFAASAGWIISCSNTKGNTESTGTLLWCLSPKAGGSAIHVTDWFRGPGPLKEESHVILHLHNNWCADNVLTDTLKLNMSLELKSCTDIYEQVGDHFHSGCTWNMMTCSENVLANPFNQDEGNSSNFAGLPVMKSTSLCSMNTFHDIMPIFFFFFTCEFFSQRVKSSTGSVLLFIPLVSETRLHATTFCRLFNISFLKPKKPEE